MPDVSDASWVKREGSHAMVSVVLTIAIALAWPACGDDRTPGRQAAPSTASTRAPARSRPATTAEPRALAVGEMTSVAGGGAELGDGGPATSAGFCGPGDVALDGAGNLYVTDLGVECQGPGGSSVRKV